MMTIIETPIGPLHAIADDAGRLVELGFRVPRSASGSSEFLGEAGHRGTPRTSEDLRGTAEALRGTARLIDQLGEYFSGKRQTFDLDLAPRGTPFQMAVWNALLEIPYGHTISYAELARRIGKPAAVRAVGTANGANPIPVIIPCHRVIGSNGTLTGYGGGIERKQWLLAHEGRRLF